MTARKMFKKLGYRYKTDDYSIEYTKENPFGVKYTIVFPIGRSYCEIIPTLSGMVHHFVRLEKELLDAINKQIEEMEE